MQKWSKEQLYTKKARSKVVQKIFYNCGGIQEGAHTP